jgi:hypothetical protein
MDQAVLEILKVSPLAAVLFYFVWSYKGEKKVSEDKYEALVTKIIERSDEQNNALIQTIANNTTIMERVERKLDASK